MDNRARRETKRELFKCRGKGEGNFFVYSPHPTWRFTEDKWYSPRCLQRIKDWNLWCEGISTIQIIPSGYICLLTNVIICNDMLCNVMLKLWFQCNRFQFDDKILTLPAVGDGHYIPLFHLLWNIQSFVKNCCNLGAELSFCSPQCSECQWLRKPLVRSQRFHLSFHRELALAKVPYFAFQVGTEVRSA